MGDMVKMMEVINNIINENMESVESGKMKSFTLRDGHTLQFSVTGRGIETMVLPYTETTIRYRFE